MLHPELFCRQQCKQKLKTLITRLLIPFATRKEGMVVEENTWEAICFWFVELCGCQTDQLKL